MKAKVMFSSIAIQFFKCMDGHLRSYYVDIEFFLYDSVNIVAIGFVVVILCRFSLSHVTAYLSFFLVIINFLFCLLDKKIKWVSFIL